MSARDKASIIWPIVPKEKDQSTNLSRNHSTNFPVSQIKTKNIEAEPYILFYSIALVEVQLRSEIWPTVPPAIWALLKQNHRQFALSETTFKKSNTCGVSNTRLYFTLQLDIMLNKSIALFSKYVTALVPKPSFVSSCMMITDLGYNYLQCQPECEGLVFVDCCFLIYSRNEKEKREKEQTSENMKGA